MSHDTRPQDESFEQSETLSVSSVPDSDLLISRIVDGEADPSDHARFEQMADADPSLWKSLARRQQEMARLTEGFENETAAAMNVALPKTSVARRGVPRVGWALTLSGWAAVLILAALWGVNVLDNHQQQRQMSGSTTITNRVPNMSAIEHFDQYKHRAPYVLDELPPELIEVEKLSDGRYVIRYKRQVEEVAFYDSIEDVPIETLPDGTGRLVRDPKREQQSK